MANLLCSLDQIPKQFQGAAISVGNFDGVHRGHAQLLRKLCKIAEPTASPVMVITFDPPPIVLLRPEVAVLPPITTIARRAELLGLHGVHAVLVLPTSIELLSLSAEQFFERLITSIAPIGMVEGPNFRFGKNRAGDTGLLEQLCRSHGVRFQTANSIDDELGMISSSRIRKLLGSGDIVQVNSMLTRTYRLEGTVARGAGRGADLGFATANLGSIHSIIPAHGVYAGRVAFNGQTYGAALNIGPNPTFDDAAAKVEIHLLDWQGDLYGRSLECDLIARIRDVRRFSNVQQLQRQIALDLEKIRDLLDNTPILP